MRKKRQKDREAVSLEHMAPDVVVADNRKAKKSKHVFAKLFCLLAACGVWMYVMNLETTDFEQVFTQIPVVIDGVTQLNADSDMSVISGYDNTVDVIISGKKSEVQNLTAEDIRVSVDVAALREAGKFTLPVQIQLPDNFHAVNENLLNAEIYVDVNTTREIPVRTVKKEYSISLSYSMSEPELSQETVTVTGPQQVLELIDCALLELNLGNLTTSATVVATPRLVGVDGMPISNPYVRFENAEITAKISVETTKTVKLTATYALPELANKWMVEFDPVSVTIKGDPLNLDQVEAIPVYTIAADTKAGEYEVGAGAIYLPNGVELKNSLDSITVRIRQVVG